MGGRLTGVCHELVKNLALKGFGRIVLVSWTSCDLTANYSTSSILFQADFGAEGPSNLKMAETIIQQAHPLNPTVEFSHVAMEDFSQLADHLEHDASIFVLVNERSPKVASSLNDLCRSCNVAFEWIVTENMQSMIINDFGNVYEYTKEIKKNVQDEIITETTCHSLSFLPISQVWQRHSGMEPVAGRKRAATVACYSEQFRLWQTRLEASGNDADITIVENASVNAIIGAIAAQEVVKGVTRKDMPIHNIVLFNGDSLDSTVISIV